MNFSTSTNAKAKINVSISCFFCIHLLRNCCACFIAYTNLISRSRLVGLGLPEQLFIAFTGSGRHSGRLRRYVVADGDYGPSHVHHRCRNRDLPGGICQRHFIQPYYPNEHREPRRRSLHRVRTARIDGFRPAAAFGTQYLVRRVDDDAARAADYYRLLAGSDQDGAAVAAERFIRARREPLADDHPRGAADGLAGHSNRIDSVVVPGNRRDGSAYRRRRGRLRGFLAAIADGYIHGNAIQIFNWASQPQAEFQNVAAAGIILLLIMLLSMNAFAIYLRNKYQRKL